MDGFTAKMDTEPSLLVTQGDEGLVTVSLNRPAAQNAIDEQMVLALIRNFEKMGHDPLCRTVILRAEGDNFCEGMDMDWMCRTAQALPHEHYTEGQGLAAMMRTLYEFPKPIIGLVHGAAVGFGVGLLACCDVVIASDSATFRLSEARFGLTPAIIAPYVVQAISVRAARRYFLTAEPFSATEAKTLGLVNEIVPDRMLDAAGMRMVERVSACGPRAQVAAKEILRHIDRRLVSDDIREEAVNLFACLRSSAEGREGLAAYQENRKPSWMKH